MIQTFDFAGTGRVINAEGSFLSYEKGAARGAPVTVRVRADGQDLGPFEPGDYVRLPKTATTWEIVPVANTCVGSVRVGPAEFNSRRVSGSVTIAPATYPLAMQSRAFATSYWSGSIVNRISEHQLWVPAAATVALIVTQVEVNTSHGDLCWVAVDGVMAPELFDRAISKLNGQIPANVGGQFENRSYSVNQRLVYTGSGRVVFLRGAALQQVQKVFNEPLVVLPGSGVTVFCENGSQVNRDFYSQVEFYQIPLSEL